MPDPPERYLDPTELSVEQHVARLQAQKRGEPEPKFERPEYRQARRELLEQHGYDADDEPADTPTDPAELSVDDHLNQIRRHT